MKTIPHRHLCMGCWEERQCANAYCEDLEWAWCHRASCELTPIMEAPERLMAAGHQLHEAGHYLLEHPTTQGFGKQFMDLRGGLLEYLQTFKPTLSAHEAVNRHMLQSPHGKPSDS